MAKKVDEAKLDKVSGGLNIVNNKPTQPGYWWTLHYKDGKWRAEAEQGGYATEAERDAGLEAFIAKEQARGCTNFTAKKGYNA